MDVFSGHLVLFVNKNGVPMLCSINLPLDANHKVLCLSFLACSIAK